MTATLTATAARLRAQAVEHGDGTGGEAVPVLFRAVSEFVTARQRRLKGKLRHLEKARTYGDVLPYPGELEAKEDSDESARCIEAWKARAMLLLRVVWVGGLPHMIARQEKRGSESAKSGGRDIAKHQ